VIVPPNMEEMPFHAASNRKINCGKPEDRPGAGWSSPFCNAVLDEKYYIHRHVE